MPSLKDLRNRIDSVKSTKKITQAMKMVAASKLKKAQSLAEKGRSYSSGLEDIVKGLVKSGGGSDNPLLNNNDKISSSLIVIVSSDRGLCGGLNTNLVKATKNKIEELQKEGKSVSLICIGKKGYDLLSVNHEEKFNLDLNYKLIGEMDYRETQDVAEKLLEKFSFDVDKFKDKTVKELPQGARKVLDILIAIIGKPKVILLDEPTSGISTDEKNVIMKNILRAIKEFNISVLFIEHDMEIVEWLNETLVNYKTTSNRFCKVRTQTFRSRAALRRSSYNLYWFIFGTELIGN